MQKMLILSMLVLSGCAWTDHHWDVPPDATPTEVKKVDLHNCQEDAFQAWRSDRISDGSVLAIGAGGVLGGAIGGATAGAAVGSSGSLSDFTKPYVKKCMAAKGYSGNGQEY